MLNHMAAGFVVARALLWVASTAANAVMFRMPRTVAVCVRMWTGLPAPNRIGPTVMLPLAATRNKL